MKQAGKSAIAIIAVAGIFTASSAFAHPGGGMGPGAGGGGAMQQRHDAMQARMAQHMATSQGRHQGEHQHRGAGPRNARAGAGDCPMAQQSGTAAPN